MKNIFLKNKNIKKNTRKIKPKVLDKVNKATDIIENNVGWLYEFSKKVVFGAFLVYLISTLAIMIFIYYTISINGNASGLDTFIAETNSTFRIVVGSYCIKATFENMIKINGNLQQVLINIKNRLIKNDIEKETGVKIKDDDIHIDNNMNTGDNYDNEIYDNGEDCTGGDDEILG